MSAELLDSILSNHNGPEIVSEQHDPNQIDYVAGSFDAAEMVKLGNGVQGAIKSALGRASLDESNGRINVVVAGTPAWHRLGVNVREALNREHAQQLGGLGFTVAKIPVQYLWQGKVCHSVETYVLVREDTGKELGKVGKRYQVIQNSDGFDFLDAVLDRFGAKYETAGVLYGGKKAWMQVHLPRQAFEAAPGDVVNPYALFTLSHDGTGADYCFATTERAVCANTLRVAVSKGRKKGISIRHTGEIKTKIADAQNALGLAIRKFDEFKDVSKELVKTPVDINTYANNVLDAVLEVTQAQALLGSDALAAAIATTKANQDLAAKKFEKQIERRQNLLEEILEKYESGRCEPRGSGWAALNAVTDAADNGLLGGRQRGDNKDSRRFESIVSGQADEVKQVAYTQVQSYLAV